MINLSDTNPPEIIEQKFKAMNIYLQEYMYRNKHMWNLYLRFFFASLVVMLLPNLTDRFQITIPEIFESNKWIFPAFGIILAIVFLYISICQVKRFKAISKTYNKIGKSLPDYIKREELDGDPNSIINRPNAHITPIIMFLGLIVLGIIILLDYIF